MKRLAEGEEEEKEKKTADGRIREEDSGRAEDRRRAPAPVMKPRVAWGHLSLCFYFSLSFLLSPFISLSLSLLLGRANGEVLCWVTTV